MIDNAVVEKYHRLTIDQKKRLLERLEELKIDLKEIPILPSIRDSELSFAEERLWFLSELNPSNTSYHLYRCLHIKGELDLDGFKQALKELIVKHEILRTGIYKEHGKPKRLVLEHVEIPLEFASLKNLTKEEINKILNEHAIVPFELKNPPLFRIHLFELGKQEHIFLLTIHHIIADGWSIDIFMDQLSKVYNCIVRQESFFSEKLPIQYSHFATWQREWYQDGLIKKYKGFWENSLKDVPKISCIPYDFSGFKIDKEANFVQIEIDSYLFNQIQGYLKEVNSTPFNFFLAVLNILINRYTQSEDIIIGTPTSGRLRTEISEVMGLFINLLPLRNKVQGEDSFTKFLKDVSKKTLEAIENQLFPFEKIVQSLDLESGIFEYPLFQVLLIYNRSKQEHLTLERMTWDTIPIKSSASKYPITIEIIEKSTSCIVTFEYDTTLFKLSTLERLSRHFQSLVQSILTNPFQHLKELSLLTEEEKRSFERWNETEREFPNLNVHDCLDQVMLQYSDAVAVEFKDKFLTYRDLKEHVDRIAHGLMRQGVFIGEPIGVYMEPGIDLIPTLLGIMKSGGCYVPLDSSFPEKRIEFILSELELRFVITDGKRGTAPPIPTIKYLEIGSLASTPWKEEFPIVEPEMQAYIMYTSGSTGTPKGIKVLHRSIVNVLNSFKNILDCSAKDKWLSTTTFSFDISVLEFFLPLLVGATIRLIDKSTVKNIDEVMTELNSFIPTIVQGTPSFWSLLIEKRWKPLGNLTILSGGESLSPNIAQGLMKMATRVYNVYGPTETTIWSTLHLIKETDEEIVIGKPIDNTKLFILDSSLAQVPINVEGELFIAGAGVSGGYIKRPELLKERFIKLPHLLGEKEVFRTRDRAKFTENGEVKFLGRYDHQIKIRGHRVEIEEIEHALCEILGIEQSVVILKKDKHNLDTLVAYIKFLQNEDISIEQCQRHLRDRLPPYMIPNQWLVLDEFPLLPNGKLNRLEVSKLNIQEEDIIQESEPLTITQKHLYKIWAENLSRNHLRLDDNYFELGGHSLLAIQLIDKIRAEAKGDVSLRDLYLNPTITSLSSLIEQKIKENVDGVVINHETIQSSIEEDLYKPFPLTDVQMAYWMGRNSVLGSSIISSHLYREIVLTDLDPDLFENVLNQLIERHPALRIKITEDGQQRFLDKLPRYKIFVHDISTYNENKAKELLDKTRNEMSHQILGEHVWPLFDIKITKDKSVLILHISVSLLIADAASFGILLKELFELYKNPSKIYPPIEITFRDYVEYLQRFEQTLEYEKAKLYWQNKVKTFPSGPFLPILNPLSTLKKPKFERLQRFIEKERWGMLIQHSKSIGVSPNAVILTAFSIILQRWSSEPHFALVLTLFNRPPLHKDIFSIVGDFTTVILFEAKVNGKESFTEIARAFQERLFSDIDHRGYSGIRFTQDLLKDGVISEPLGVVFTSLLGLSSFDSETAKSLEYDQKVKSFDITQTPQVMLDHQIVEHAGGVCLNWDYVTEVFPDQLIQSMFETYIHFLEELSTSKDRWDIIPLFDADWIVQTAEMSSMKKQREMRVGWDSKHQFLYEGILEQGLVNPDKVAIVQGQHRLTYSELCKESFKIKAFLLSLKLPKETLVGILMDKNWRQISSALGVMMAGCAYMPIDASYPRDRIAELLETSSCRYVIVFGLFEGFAEVKLFPYDLITYHHESDKPSDSEISPLKLAYVMYTSGSTGAPKGVMITHHAAMNTIHAVNKRLNLTHHDCVYGISSFGFDLSVYDIFGVLGCGGKLVLPESHSIRNPEQWLSDLFTHQVTIWNSVPFFMTILIEYLSDKEHLKSNLFSIRTIMLSGDWIPVTLPSQIHSISSEIEIISLGGATETAMWSIWFNIEFGVNYYPSIPYGESMGNQQVLILDSNLEEVPIWLEGEIYISGEGVALGYWQNEEMTKRQFLTHPKWGRLFRTYDKGRYHPDGNIEFLGRSDHQVKVGGFRIELPEIEAKICQHPRVKKAIASVINKGNFHKEIHAFLVLKGERERQQEVHIKPNSLHCIRRELETNDYQKFNLTERIPTFNFKCRSSIRSFAQTPINQNEFSQWLSCLQHIEIDGNPLYKAFYASAGTIYPIQVYLHIKKNRINGLPEGNYYYHPFFHQLIKISDDVVPTDIFAPNNLELAHQSAFYIFLIADGTLIQEKYPLESSLYSHLEAGLITQLLEMQAMNTSLGLCQVGKTRFKEIASFFKLPDSAKYTHGLVGGILSIELQNERNAYAATAQDINEKEIAQFLRKKLPSYMIPTSISILSELPTTINGKIDQKALVKAAETKSTVGHRSVSRHNHLSETINEAWKMVLNCPTLPDRQTSFFDLGGNSFKLVQLHCELEQVLEISIPIADLFRYSTIDAQVEFFSNKTKTKSDVLQKSRLRAQIREKSRG